MAELPPRRRRRRGRVRTANVALVLAALLPVHPAPDVLAQAVDVHPGVDQADVVATRHLMQNFVETSISNILDIILVLLHAQSVSDSTESHLTVTKRHTVRTHPGFSYLCFETFQICHNFSFLVVPETLIKFRILWEFGSFFRNKFHPKLFLHRTNIMKFLNEGERL